MNQKQTFLAAQNTFSPSNNTKITLFNKMHTKVLSYTRVIY